ncbi:MAG: segregation/condensation protein A [Clostridia bacterium]|nr:segregation/condensation protein A [Clostridia bacterium]
MEDKSFTCRIDAFEGPLDLLLALISKNKVSIIDIPIVMIFDQYMEYIEEAKRMDLEIASDFIVMAAELMLIKSKMLLPRDKDDTEDPRKVLVDALLLYQEAKQNAEGLKPLYTQYSGRMAKDNDEVPPEKGFPLGLDPDLLFKALRVIVARKKNEEPEPTTLVNPLIKTKIVSVKKMIGEVLLILEKRSQASLFYLLKDSTSKAELIARFMGILEMVKLQQVFIVEPDTAVAEDEEISYPEDEFGGNTLTGLLIQIKLNPDYQPDEAAESEFDHEDEDDDDGNNPQ